MLLIWDVEENEEVEEVGGGGGGEDDGPVVEYDSVGPLCPLV